MILLKIIPLFGAFYVVAGVRYEFMVNNDEVFDDCPGMSGMAGIRDAFDLSEVQFEYVDGNIRCSGNATCTWEGVEPTDRIEYRGELLKFQHGSWQPTVFTVAAPDFCKLQFAANTLWYQMWTRNIPEAERKCINNYGHTYHHESFEMDTVAEHVTNMDGRHKIVGKLMAYDEYNVKRPIDVCFEILGEFVKL